METHLEKRKSPDCQSPERGVTIRRGLRRGRGRRSSWEVRGAPSFEGEDAGQSVIGRTASSGSSLPVHTAFVHVSQEADVPVLMRSTNSAWLSRTLEHNNKTPTFSRAEKSAEPVLGVVAERDDRLLRLNNYKVSK